MNEFLKNYWPLVATVVLPWIMGQIRNYALQTQQIESMNRLSDCIERMQEKHEKLEGKVNAIDVRLARLEP